MKKILRYLKKIPLMLLLVHISMQAMINVRQQALQNIQCRQKVYYDATHNIDKGQYKVGAVVLLRNSKKLTKKGSKMEPNWIGPYQVLSKGTCRLSQAKKPNKVLAQKFNISQLKLYHQNGFMIIFCASKSYLHSTKK